MTTSGSFWASSSILLLAFVGLSFVGLHSRPAAAASAYALARMGDAAVLELPAGSRDEIPEHIEVSGPWVLAGTVAGVRTWQAPLPIRPRALFFHRAPDGMQLLRRDPDRASWSGARNLTYDERLSAWEQEASWAFSGRGLQVRRLANEGPPRAGEYAVQYSVANEREAALNLEASGLAERDFAFRSLQLDDTSQQGIFLPAPARASFRLTVPEGAILDLSAVLLPPEAADSGTGSDGAGFRVEVGEDGEATVIYEADLSLGAITRHVVDLSAHAGREIQLHLVTEPGPTATLDYVFLAEPTIRVPTERPRRVVVIFVDTLRQDHLSVYDYERPTTPRLKKWAQQAAVFDQARSVAPWTLPSARSLLTGHQPELWDHTPTLQARFAEEGWATAFIAGNVYLSSNFDMHKGWGTHRCINWPVAGVQVDRALRYLDEHDDQPVFMVLHLMDMHLPYTEPPTYRYLFAGARPELLSRDAFQRSEVVAKQGRLGKEGKQYVRDRYDNNLRYVDDQVARVLDRLGEDDVVVLMSDHGEEFWDHGGFEHGHSLYDELLKVPLIVKAPGVTAGRFATPVSTQDIAPTLLQAAGLDVGETGGRLLQAVAADPDAHVDRAVVFGRPLYGRRQWGAYQAGLKYITRDGKEMLFDLTKDAQERRDRVRQGDQQPEAGRKILAGALDQDVPMGFRIEVNRKTDSADLEVDLLVPGGASAAWAGEDPIPGEDVEVTIEGEVVHARWSQGPSVGRELFVHPIAPATEVAGLLELTARRGKSTTVERVAPDTDLSDDGRGNVLIQASVGGRKLALTYATAPAPGALYTEINAYNPEVREELKVLGYLDEDEPEPDTHPDP